jgi:type I restriction enzyme S subunit
MVRLGDVAEIISGQSPPSSSYNTDGVGLPFYQGKADFGERHPVPRVWCTAPERTAQDGDVLVSVRAPVGPTNVARDPCAIGRGLAAIRASTELDRDFLLYVLRWLEPTVKTLGSGSTFESISRHHLADLMIPIAPLARQKALALLLDGESAIHRNLQEAARTRATQVLGVRLRCLEAAFLDAEPLAVDPARTSALGGWRWNRLTDRARLESGHTPSRSRDDWWGGDIPWIQLADIRAVDGQVIYSTSETTNPEGIAHSAARILPADTVVMSRTASVGFVARMGRPMATSQDFVNWVCGPDLDPEFLMHLLIRSRDYIRSLSAGAIHKTVYYPTVKDFHVCIPPIAEQRRIAAELRERLATIDEMTRAIDAQLGAIDALPAALLGRAFAEIEAAKGAGH